MRHLTIVLPTLDEAGAIGSVIDHIPMACPRDRGLAWAWLSSTVGARTGRLSSLSKGAIVHQQPGIGKGDALRFGFSEFLQSGDDALVMLDADGTYRPEEVPGLLHGLSDVPVMVGDRLNGRMEKRAMSRFNLLGNLLLTWLAVALHGTMIPDLCTGMWAFRREAIAGMSLNSMRFEIEAELYASCAPAEPAHRFDADPYGTRIGDPKLGSIGDGATILGKIVVRRVFTEALEPKLDGGGDP